ncbi:hypothetical protein ACM64Y_07650 [Novispirillum sp. DQ9]|uniref:hypothetical protein n=1 Tax=Novispirillum sp. DQ9 TaxID=3398612 RepID=UPI003C7D3B85
MARHPKPDRPPVAGADEDPNVEEIEVASPPCFAHELDEAGRPRQAKPKPNRQDG